MNRRFTFFLILSLLVVAVLVPKSFAATVNVEKISAFKMADSVRVIIQLDHTVAYHSFSLDNPKRWVIDLKDTNVIEQKNLPDFAHVAWIKPMRAGSNQVGVQRVVFTFTEAVGAKIALLKPVKNLPWRLVIDLSADQARSKKNASVGVEKKSAQHLVSAQTQQGVQALIGKVAEREDDRHLRCVNVIIDPGHGGRDTGAIGLQGIREKDVVLSISNYLKSMLKKTPGVCVFMTRDSDYFVSLRGRLAIARKDNADLFVAIHADIFNDSRAQGASVFALSQRGATSESARWLAQSENTSELIGGTALTNKSEKLRSVLISLSQHATTNSSLELGSDVLENLNDVSHLHHARVEQAGFVVLKSPDIPSILVETGFLSNEKEERQLRQRAYQKKIALAIYRGIMEYMHAYPPPGTKILAWDREKSQAYQVKPGDTLSAIAEKFDTSIDNIMERNDLSSRQINIGQVLLV